MLEGKTKTLTPLWTGSDHALVTNKYDITAGDGAKRDVIPGKAELATRTTCNVFEYLRRKNIPIAYIGRDGPATFLTQICTMIPVEVVVRNIATGSYLKRNPDLAEGHIFAEPEIEFFYKTSGRRAGSQSLPCDDPLMRWCDRDTWYDLSRPDKPFGEGGYIGVLNLPTSRAEALHENLERCTPIALDVNKYLAGAWRVLDGELYDFKLEFGMLIDGSIVLADVVDCDSWRVKWKGLQLSKQGYRDGDDLDRVLGVYRLAASLTDRFI